MDDFDHPVAEGLRDGLWCVAYAAPSGALDVLVYRQRCDTRDRMHLGACVFAGRFRASDPTATPPTPDRWLSTIGDVHHATLRSVTTWAKEVTCGG